MSSLEQVLAVNQSTVTTKESDQEVQGPFSSSSTIMRVQKLEARLKRILDQTIQSYDSMIQISLDLNLSLLPSIDPDYRPTSNERPDSLLIYHHLFPQPLEDEEEQQEPHLPNEPPLNNDNDNDNDHVQQQQLVPVSVIVSSTLPSEPVPDRVTEDPLPSLESSSSKPASNPLESLNHGGDGGGAAAGKRSRMGGGAFSNQEIAASSRMLFRAGLPTIDASGGGVIVPKTNENLRFVKKVQILPDQHVDSLLR